MASERPGDAAHFKKIPLAGECEACGDEEALYPVGCGFYCASCSDRKELEHDERNEFEDDDDY